MPFARAMKNCHWQPENFTRKGCLTRRRLAKASQFCSEFSVRLIWVSSTTSVTRWWQLFIRYRHINYYSVYHTRRDMLFYLPKSAYPWFIPPRGIPIVQVHTRQASVKHDDRTACLEHVRYSAYSLREAMSVGPHPTLFLVLHYAGLLPASLYTHQIATAFWLVTQELPYFSENRRTALPPHWRWQIRSRVLPDQAR
jgi:hypothetical protein